MNAAEIERMTLGIVTIAPRRATMAETRGCRSCPRAGAGGDSPAISTGAAGDSPSAFVGIGATLLVYGLLGLAGYGAYHVGQAAWGPSIGAGVGGVAVAAGGVLLAESIPHGGGASDVPAGIAALGVIGLAGYGAYDLAGVPGVIGAGAGMAALTYAFAG